MSRLMKCSLIGTVACLPPSGEVLAADRLPAHTIVAQKMIDALPADIAPLYRERLESFELRVAEPADAWPRDPTLRPRNSWHSCEPDLAATSSADEARLSASRAFPRDKTSARRVYRQHGRPLGGALPWAIDECHRDLERAFRKGTEAAVLAASGHLTHFIADALDPLRVSVVGTVARTEHARFGTGRGPHPNSPHFTVVERYGVGLIGRYAGSYLQDIVLSADEYTAITDARSAAFSVIEASIRYADDVAAADREVIADLQIADLADFTRLQESYYRSMHDRCGDICRNRLRAGALTTAELIGGAWQLAGSPSLSAIRARATSQPESTGKNPESAAFVGSDKSVVFHKPGCRFAKQISPENLVTFALAQHARDNGRRACKTCKPE